MNSKIKNNRILMIYQICDFNLKYNINLNKLVKKFRNI